MKNIGDCLEQVLQRKHALVRQAAQIASAAPTQPPLLTGSAGAASISEHAARDDGSRLARAEATRALHASGMSLHSIARRLGLARNTVRRYVRADSAPSSALCPRRSSLLTSYEPYLRGRWTAGCHNARQLYDEITGQGYAGRISIVRTLVRTWRTGSVPASAPRVYTPRQTMWLLRRSEADVDAAEGAYLDALRRLCPELGTAQALTQEFIALVHGHDGGALHGWLARAAASGLREFIGFADGVRRDQAAVEAGVTTEWSSGMVEGHVNRLKLIKRQAYGRAGFALLRRRVVCTA